MMDACGQQGDFPPNPFRPSDPSGSSAAAAGGGGGASQPQPQQEPLPAGVPPASQFQSPREDAFGEDSISFQPASTSMMAESQFVGSGPMDGGGGGGLSSGTGPGPEPVSGTGGGGYQQPPSAQMGMGSTPSVPGGAAGGILGTVQSCLSLDTYRIYFDVDTADIVKRVVSAVRMCNVPDGFRNDVMGVTSSDGKGPDLYGPFWITATMVFFLAVISNMHGYLHRDDVEEFEADISHLVHAMPVLYSFTFLIPLALFLVLRCVAIPFPLMELVCLYGYSLIPYAPTLLLCLIPVNFLEWVFLLVATCVSCLLILRNVATPILSSDVGMSKAPALVMFVVACHVIFVLVLKFAFFHHRFNNGGSGSSDSGGGSYPPPATAPTPAADSGGDEGGDGRYLW